MRERKLSRFRIILTVLTILAVLYLIGLYTVPFMEPLRQGFYPWLLYIVFVLILVCLWTLSGKKQRYSKHGEDKIDNEKMEVTKAVLSEKNKWYW